MSDKATIEYQDKKIEVDAIVGSEGEIGIDITQLRAKTGMITLDPGYGNTGSCTSDITFIDGEKGILRHRGYAIEDLADNATFMETALLVLYGHLPTQAELDAYIARLKSMRGLPDDLKTVLEMIPASAHPMDVQRTGVSFLGNIEPEGDFENQAQTADRLLATLPSMLL